jgi:hypothetical protein
MEVTRMTHDDRRDAKREQAIEQILGVRSKWDAGVGIYGADVCALCGQLDTFSGWAMATYGCHIGPHREYVCRACWRRIVPKSEWGISAQHGLITAALRESKVRYCRLCQAQIERHPRWGTGEPFVRLCATCLEGLRHEDIIDADEIAEMLRGRVRRRYLELLDSSELEQMSGMVVEMREDLDSQFADQHAHEDES